MPRLRSRAVSSSPDDLPEQDRILFVDLELTEAGELFDIGAVLGDQPFRRRVASTSDAVVALAELDRFGRKARWLAGHNLIAFDLPHLRRFFSAAATRPPRILRLPAIDTLLLSPLSRPEKPYHDLVKDYKLQRDAQNDPLADARLARELLATETSLLREIGARDPELFALLRSPLVDWKPDGDLPQTAVGTADWLERLGAGRLRDGKLMERAVARHVHRACAPALRLALERLLADPRQRAAAAYVFAWLEVAQTHSVLPRWVHHHFPAAGDLIRAVRDASACGRTCDWCRRMHDPRALLKEHFDHDSFQGQAGASGRPVQEEVIRLGLDGESSLAILPTGFGKSICYQLPALVRHARTGVLTIVVSPLQALMLDQVKNLNEKLRAEPAAALNGLLTPLERARVLERTRLGELALLYVSPEQMRNRSFRETIRAREIAAWVFDEAHCLAKWGHDFRTDYHYAGRFLREFHQRERTPVAPVHCFTATARHDVRGEILDYFKDAVGLALKVIELPPKRDNLTFEVIVIEEARKVAAIEAALRRYLPDTPSSGRECGKAIVYCATRRRTETTADALKQRGFDAAAFHAGLEATAKRDLQHRFANGAPRIICATNAFGMGIDEPCVRLVVHLDIPGSLENYLQEAGRAGRDRVSAHCLLLFAEPDVDRQFDLLDRSCLKPDDISAILLAVRRCRPRAARPDSIVVTAGELLHDDRTDVSFEAVDRDARTKVQTAVSWLERGGFLLRDENETNVFQGRPKVESIEKGRARIEQLRLSPRQREQWTRLLELLFRADPRDVIDMDELAHELGMRPRHEPASTPASDPSAPNRNAARKLRQTLNAMVANGLLSEGLMLTAFVQLRGARSSRKKFDELQALDSAFLAALREAAHELEPWQPGGTSGEDDAPNHGWMPLDLRQVSARLREQGHEVHPLQLQKLLSALSVDGRGEGPVATPCEQSATEADDPPPTDPGHCGSLDARHRGADQWRVRLRRGWEALDLLAQRRRAASEAVLEMLLPKATSADPGRGEVLVEFGLSEMVAAVAVRLAGIPPEEAQAAAERALLHLHELEVVTLQRGLALFRQAMTVRLVDRRNGQKWTKEDHAALQSHYEMRKQQVHVLRRWAEQMTVAPTAAQQLVSDYFSQRNDAFLDRWFRDRRKELALPVNPPTFARIVTDLRHEAQREIVTRKAEEDVLVLAGPGSGKTRVVVHRCAWLLQIARVPPEAILILCFNRGAAHELRRRLRDLAGDLARRVTIHTYHALALRLTGRTFERERIASVNRHAGNDAVAGSHDKDAAFQSILREAIALLRGGDEDARAAIDDSDVEARSLRQRLLAGFRHVLVDEYQDVDQEQYELIRILAGYGGLPNDEEQATAANSDALATTGPSIAARELSPNDANSTIAARRQGKGKRREERACVLAVGDDDQMIYGWRGADARWMRRFEQDYSAKPVFLIDNHRSSPPIIEASNRIIAPAPGRMKVDHPIRPVAEGAATLAARDFARRDSIGRGRVQRFVVADRASQLATFAAEISRLRELGGASATIDWNAVAVLARRHVELDPVRAWCETNGVPARRRISSDQRIRLHRVREFRVAFERLAAQPPSTTATPKELRALLSTPRLDARRSPWRRLLDAVIDDWHDEVGDDPALAREFAAFLHEQLSDEERDQAIGNGLFLGSVHAAKGLEFDHVFVLDGSWSAGHREGREGHQTREQFLVEERRSYYVAMTRAKLTLHLFQHRDVAGGFASELPSGERWLLDREAATTAVAPELLRRRYELLSLRDFDLGYAGGRAASHPIHRALAELSTGDAVELRTDPDSLGRAIDVFDRSGRPVARLSKDAAERWRDRIGEILEARIIAMLERRHDDGSERDRARYGNRVQLERWELPILELTTNR